MKLIDILLSELPERGGWPVGMVTCCQSVIDSEIYFYRNSKNQGEGAPELADFSFYPSKRQRSEARGYFYVTRDEYESALPGNPVPSRSAICDVIYGAICKADRKDNRSDEAGAVYDAIAAGKIPGVKLEDLVVSVAPKKIHDHVCTPCFAGYGDCAGECHVYDLNREFDAAAAVMQEYFPNGGRDMDNVESLVKAICLGKVPGVNFRRGAKVDPYQGLDEAAKPLMKWIAENCNPHSTVIVDGGSAVLYSAENSVITDEFIKD